MKSLCIVFLTFLFSLSARENLYPHLSEDSWYFFADWKLSIREKFDPSLVQKGDVVLIEDIHSRLWETLEYFAVDILPRLAHPVVLVTPRTDFSLPGKFDFLLKSDSILAWFVQNIDRPPTEKLFPVPIGLSSKIWRDPAPLDRLGPAALAQPVATRPFFVYVNFTLRGEERKHCWQLFEKFKGAYLCHEKPFEAYVQDLAQSIFVISPPGNGEDCHRTWEALLMGCYPVVKTSPLNPLFENLPVVIVDRWENVTEEFLQTQLEEFGKKQWSRNPLYAPYWFDKVRNYL